MNDSHNTESVLFALFQLSRETGHISAATLAAAAHTTPTLAARALVELERAGLVDATRARLTMPGLMAAARMQASGCGGPALDLESARRAVPLAEPAAQHQVPVAASSVPPPATPESHERQPSRRPQPAASERRTQQVRH